MVILKHTPEDFLVEEVPSRTWTDTGPLLVYRATKRDMTTPEMVRRLAEASGLHPRAIRYAGMKDRRAITSQFITAERALRPVDSVALDSIGRTGEHLSLGELKENRFRITAREVREVRDAAIPNYFGDQRFSRDNVRIGLALLKGEYALVAEEVLKQATHARDKGGDPLNTLKRAPQKLLLLYIHAVQSWLWNEAVSAYVAQQSPDAYGAPYRHGTLRFPAELPALDIPLVGAAQDLGEWEGRYLSLMEEAGISPMHFRLRSLPHLTQEGELRALRMDIREKGLESHGDVCRLRLTLAPGSYATVCVSGWIA